MPVSLHAGWMWDASGWNGIHVATSRLGDRARARGAPWGPWAPWAASWARGPGAAGPGAGGAATALQHAGRVWIGRRDVSCMTRQTSCELRVV